MAKTEIVKYNLGVVLTSMEEIGGEFVVKHICACGEKTEGRYINRADIPREHVCDECDNDNFLNLGAFKERAVRPNIVMIEKSSKGFILERTNLSTEFDNVKEEIKVVRQNMTRRIEFNYVEGTLKCYKNGELEYEHKNRELKQEGEITVGGYKDLRRIQAFILKNVNPNDLILQVSSDEFYEFYAFALGKVKNVSSYYGRRQNAFYTRDKFFLEDLIKILDRKKNHNCAQILASAGFKNIDNYYNVGRWDDNYNLNIEGTNPSDILKLPKFAIKYIKDVSNNIDSNGIANLRKYTGNSKHAIENNKLSSMFKYAKEKDMLNELIGNLDDFVRLTEEFKFNIKTLTEYIFVETNLYQGIQSPREAMNLLRDYVNMANQMGFNYERYPKSLKKVHDIMSINYKSFKQNIVEEDFKIATMKYSELAEMSHRREFAILIPETSKEIVTEGNNLNHCIASYASRVQEGKTNILFMRKRDNIDKSLVSIEVKNGRVVQARGQSNRKLTAIEQDFLQGWGERKNVIV